MKPSSKRASGGNGADLRCVTCGRTFDVDERIHTCPECGPIRGTLDVLYDYDAAREQLNRRSLAQSKLWSHLRYLPLLPIRRPEHIQPMQVGWTPLSFSSELADKLGLGLLFIKDDTRNPTGSTKDRASSIAIVNALESGAEVAAVASTGNAASSWAAYTATAGLRTVVFVPESTPKAKLTQLGVFGAQVLLVKGTYDDAFDLCCQAANEWGWYNRSTAINPFLGEGKKTAAFEICEQLRWEPPDRVFVPVGDGCILQGMWKGFKEFHKIGLVDRLPKMIGVQAEGCAPLVKAFERKTLEVDQVVPETVADSIGVGMPRDQVKALRAVDESNGTMLSVSDQEILAAVTTLARATGIFAEPAAAAGFAGLAKMARGRQINPSERIVLMVTGSGLKNIEGCAKAIERKPVAVGATLDDVGRKLRKIRFHKQ